MELIGRQRGIDETCRTVLLFRLSAVFFGHGFSPSIDAYRPRSASGRTPCVSSVDLDPGRLGNGVLPSKACSTMPSSKSPSDRSSESASALSTLSMRFSIRTPVCKRSTIRLAACDIGDSYQYTVSRCPRRQTTVEELLAWLKDRIGRKFGRTGTLWTADHQCLRDFRRDLAGGAKQIGRDYELAMKLWKTGWLEARILAAFLGDPEQLTLAQMDAGAGISTTGAPWTPRVSRCSIVRRWRGRWSRRGRSERRVPETRRVRDDGVPGRARQDRATPPS